MWFRRRQGSDFEAEIECHIRLEADRLIAEGMSPVDAQDAARRAFGNVSIARETFYESRPWQWLGRLSRDLQFGLRLLRKSPGFTAAAGLTIALAVGANTAVFSLMDAVLVRMLPVQKPKELVFLNRVNEATSSSRRAPYPCLAQLPSATNAFTGLAIFATDELRVEIDGKPEQIYGQVASGNYFELLGVKPALGRVLRGDDENLNPPIAMISDRYWQRRFHGDPAVIGKPIRVGDQAYVIAGITPPEFLGLEPGRSVDITIPIEISRGLMTGSERWWFSVVARLKPGVSAGQAQVASNVAFSGCVTNSDSSPERKAAWLEVRPASRGMDALRRQFSKPLFTLMGIVILVLLLATFNIANLLLARSFSRTREFAVRVATGAGRAHLTRQLLTEVLLLFGLGAVPGILFAFWGVNVVESLVAQGRRPITLEADLNWRILAFSLAITLAAALFSGLFPVLRAFGADPGQAIKEGHARTSESRGSSKLMGTLVGLQVAVSLVLLVGAITFGRTLANLSALDPGFRNDAVLTMSVETSQGHANNVWRGILEAVRQIPGASTASLCVFTPLSGRDSTASVLIAGHEAASADDKTIRVNYVSDGYFETLGIRLIRGRFLTPSDNANDSKAALINEAAARAYFRDRDPIGQSLEFPREKAASDVYQIVGVVQDTKHKNLRDPSPRFAFLPIRPQSESYRRLTLIVSSAGSQTIAVEPIRNTLSSVDPTLLISEVITMRGQIESTLLTERLLSGLSSVFGILAVILAAVGLYGVLSYRIGQQRQSIGIRMALGATPSSVIVMVLRRSGLLVGVGLVCGLPVAFVAAKAAGSMLWGVRATDVTTYAMAAVVMCAVGLISAWIPARRAATVEPAEVLRGN